jgi:hypothetical protein
MDSQDVNNEEQSMRLSVAFLHWAVCLGVFILLVFLATTFKLKFFGFLAFFFYLGAGIYLSRAVLRKIIVWHPMYNTLSNVVDQKIKMMLFWPTKYFFLFMSLAINKGL